MDVSNSEQTRPPVRRTIGALRVWGSLRHSYFKRLQLTTPRARIGGWPTLGFCLHNQELAAPPFAVFEEPALSGAEGVGTMLPIPAVSARSGNPSALALSENRNLHIPAPLISFSITFRRAALIRV